MSISYWLDKNNINKTQSKKYDVIIVGGGIAGLSAAYWLQIDNPQIKIAIIEKGQIGSGASGRNAGFVTCGSTEHFIKLTEQFGLEKATEIWKFSEVNRELMLEHIVQDQAGLLDFRHTGSCTVAPSSEHWVKYKKIAQTMRSQGIDVIEVGPSELEKDYGVTGFEGGVQYQGDGYIHPIKLLNKMKEMLKVDFYENTEVFSLKDQNDIQQVQTDKGIFECEKVLLTVNAYLPLLMSNFSSVLSPGRGQIMVTEPLPHFVKGPCYLTKHLCYFRQLPSGHLLIGGFRNLATDIENTYADETTDLIQDALFNFVKSHFKYGAQAKVAYKWAGIMGFSKDGQMMIGALPQNKNIHVMAGCSGHGMGLSFHAAKVLAESVNGKNVPTHLSLSRFFQ